MSVEQREHKVRSLLVSAVTKRLKAGESRYSAPS